MAPCGPRPVQLRFATGHTSEDYVSRQAWRDASLPRCPRHPHGGCGFARHGTYARKSPPGTRISRWYCRKAHQTFSLLPDCLAARLSGTLPALEAVVRAVEQASSLEVAADRLRPHIELPGAVRWTRRRVQGVARALSALRGLAPERFAACAPTLAAFEAEVGRTPVLVALRAVAAAYLMHLPAPFGLCPRLPPGGEPSRRVQHTPGPDPPRAAR